MPYAIFTNPAYKAKDRITAIRDLRDWGYGRPKQAIELSGPSGGPLETRDISTMTSSERGRELVRLLVEAGAKVVSPKQDEPNGSPGGA